MKKLLPICISIIVVGCSVAVFLSQCERKQILPISNEIGDASFSKKIQWKSKFSNNFTHFELLVKDGVAQVTFEDESQSQEGVAYYAQKEYYEKGEQEGNYIHGIGPCSTIQEQVDSLFVRYELYGLGIVQPVMIQTELKESSNASYYLKKEVTICEKGEHFYSHQKIFLTDEDTWEGSYLHPWSSRYQDEESKQFIEQTVSQSLAKVDDAQYVFLPFNDKYTEGTPSIYRIRLSNKVRDIYHDSSVEELVYLPEGRIYEDLQVNNNQLLVYSHDKTSLYVQVYGLDGTLYNETSFAYPEKTDRIEMSVYYSTHYMMIADGQKIFIVDQEDPNKKQQLDWTGGTILDLFYKDDTLYIASIGEKENLIVFQAIQQQKVVYQGVVTLEPGNEKRFQGWNNGEFSREEEQ